MTNYGDTLCCNPMGARRGTPRNTSLKTRPLVATAYILRIINSNGRLNKNLTSRLHSTTLAQQYDNDELCSQNGIARYEKPSMKCTYCQRNCRLNSFDKTKHPAVQKRNS